MSIFSVICGVLLAGIAVVLVIVLALALLVDRARKAIDAMKFGSERL